jgi:hypothetical protein
VWKTAFRLAHLKRQHQILASGGVGPLSGAHGVLPAAGPAIGQLETALDYLALAATKDTAILQQLTSANLALTATIRTLTATNKKLVDATAPAKGTPTAGTPSVTPGEGVRIPPHPGNYCWRHGRRISKEHTSATCARKAMGHRDDATVANTLGGSEKDKGWYTACT